MEEKVFLYLDLNSFFASCEQQADVRLRGLPVAVVPMLVDSTCCIAASYEAKRMGVKTGTLVRDAKKMCPGIVFRVGHHDLYIKYHHQVIQAVEQCVPIHSIGSIDEVACELTGTQKNIKVAIHLALKIKKNIREQVGEMLTSSIGIGPNILLAKMASDFKKPDGLTIIQKSDLPHKLLHLKLQDIPGVGARMNHRLCEMGIRSMEQLLSLNESEMRRVWGSVVGARYYHLLRGAHIESARSSTQSIGHQHVLPTDKRTWLGAQRVAEQLISKSMIRLRKSDLMAKKLSVDIKYFNEIYWSEGIKFDETQDTILVLNKFHTLYRHAPQNKKPIKVSVVLSDFVSSKEHQLSFFENEKREQLFRVVDEINEKYGRDTVYVGSLHNEFNTAPTRIAFSRIPDLDEVE